jgi:hypothetical protein
MGLKKASGGAVWTMQTLNLHRKQSADWQLCFTLEDETFASMNKKHHQQRRTLIDETSGTGDLMNLMNQQVREIREWHTAVEKYRNALHTRLNQETVNLDKEKQELATFL